MIVLVILLPSFGHTCNYPSHSGIPTSDYNHRRGAEKTIKKLNGDHEEKGANKNHGNPRQPRPSSKNQT